MPAPRGLAARGPLPRRCTSALRRPYRRPPFTRCAAPLPPRQRPPGTKLRKRSLRRRGAPPAPRLTGAAASVDSIILPRAQPHRPTWRNRAKHRTRQMPTGAGGGGARLGRGRPAPRPEGVGAGRQGCGRPGLDPAGRDRFPPRNRRERMRCTASRPLSEKSAVANDSRGVARPLLRPIQTQMVILFYIIRACVSVRCSAFAFSPSLTSPKPFATRIFSDIAAARALLVCYPPTIRAPLATRAPARRPDKTDRLVYIRQRNRPSQCAKHHPRCPICFV